MHIKMSKIVEKRVKAKNGPLEQYSGCPQFEPKSDESFSINDVIVCVRGRFWLKL